MKSLLPAAVLSLALLGACGPSQQLVQAQADLEVLRKEKAQLTTKVTEVEGQLKKVSQERDQLKAQLAKATPAPAAPAPAKKPSTTVRK